MRAAVLVIAGSDSSGGAGLQADLKALDHIGVHGATAVTCLTSQSSTEVRTVYPLSAGAVLDQAAAVLSDLDVRAVKCGMLYSESIIRAVADLVEDRGLPAVVDPVLAATSGGRLALDGGASAYMRHLVPLAWAVTPNAHEAEALLGFAVEAPADAARAARRLVGAGASSAVVKGGHLRGRREVVDTLATPRQGGRPRIELARSARVPGEFHGAGCHFASFLAGFAARGLPQDRAFHFAHAILQQTILRSEPLGRGPRFLLTPPHRFVVEDGLDRARGSMAWELAAAVLGFVRLLDRTALPEVGANFGYARARARSPDDVCAVDGRIIVSQGRAVAAGPIRFGASRHIARILMACAKVAPSVRSACNLRFDPALLRRARASRLSLATFDRAQEPRGREARGSTMSWGTARAIRAFGRVPDLIADAGGVGKEPMIRVLGRNPADVLRKVRRLLRA